MIDARAVHTVVAAIAVAVSVVACGAETSGVSGGPSVTQPPTSRACTDVTHSDPTIAFEASLRDGDRLAVGATGWVDTHSRASEIRVSGRSAVVTLTDRSIATEQACGVARNWVSWVEVNAENPGEVTLRIPDGPADGISLTVT